MPEAAAPLKNPPAASIVLACRRIPKIKGTAMTAHATYPDLAGRTVFVSGGAAGIGEAIVRAFAAQGAKVGFVDIAADEGARLAGELSGEGADVRFERADVTDIASLKAAIARDRRRARPDRRAGEQRRERHAPRLAGRDAREL